MNSTYPVLSQISPKTKINVPNCSSLKYVMDHNNLSQIKATINLYTEAEFRKKQNSIQNDGVQM